MAKRGSEGPSGLQSGAISRRLVGDGAISMLYNTKNSLMQCWRRPVTRITTLAPARAFSVNGLQDLDFLTASHGRGSDRSPDRGRGQSLLASLRRFLAHSGLFS